MQLLLHRINNKLAGHNLILIKKFKLTFPLIIIFTLHVIKIRIYMSVEK